MNFSYGLLAGGILITLLASPRAATLCCGDEPLAAGTAEALPPVVTGPVPPPIAVSESVVPAYGCETVLAPPPPRRSSSGPAGNVSGRPFGAASRSLFGAQIANGQAASMVLYRFDFVSGRAALAPAGRRKLARLAAELAQTPLPLIIEPSRAEPALDRARRRTIIRALAGLPYPVPRERIVIAPPRSHGMQGVEAERLHQRFLEIMTDANDQDASGFSRP